LRSDDVWLQTTLFKPLFAITQQKVCALKRDELKIAGNDLAVVWGNLAPLQNRPFSIGQVSQDSNTYLFIGPSTSSDAAEGWRLDNDVERSAYVAP
jgi:hypothetical protein